MKIENQYIQEKFNNKADFINVEGQLDIKGLIKTPAPYKCYYRVNSYRVLKTIFK